MKKYPLDPWMRNSALSYIVKIAPVEMLDIWYDYNYYLDVYACNDKLCNLSADTVQWILNHALNMGRGYISRDMQRNLELWEKIVNEENAFPEKNIVLQHIKNLLQEYATLPQSSPNMDQFYVMVVYASPALFYAYTRCIIVCVHFLIISQDKLKSLKIKPQIQHIIDIYVKSKNFKIY
jgi:hypothetical protein